MKRIYLNDVKHPIYAFIIVALVALALKGGAEWQNFYCALIGVCAAEAALFGKEIWDKVHRKRIFDWFDIKIGQIGVGAGFLCAWIWM